MGSIEWKTEHSSSAGHTYIAVLLSVVMTMIRSYETLQNSKRRYGDSYLHIPTQFLPPIAITAPPLYSRID
jgi:hypothetical protein